MSEIANLYRNRCHKANKYEYIVNLQRRRHIVAAVCLQLVYLSLSMADRTEVGPMSSPTITTDGKMNV